EFLPALSRGDGLPTPTIWAEYTTVELKYGAGRAFEAVLAAEQPRMRGEGLGDRVVVGGVKPRYVRLRPRKSLAAILERRADQTVPDKVNDLVAKVSVEALILRPDMLVNVTPVTDR